MIYVNSVEVFPKNVTIKKGEFFYDFGAEVSPANADCKCLAWRSDDSNVAVVNPDTGYIYAKGFGTTTIWATATDGSGWQDGIVVTVASSVPVTLISLNKNRLTLDKDEQYTFTASIAPTHATNQTLVWETSDSTVVTVTDGMVCAIAAGTATITARAADGSGVSAACTVTVNPVRIRDITLMPDELALNVNDTFELTCIIDPEDATNQTVRWTSEDSWIADVDDTGFVTAKSVGTTYICAHALDGSGARGCCVVTCHTSDADSIPEHSHIYHAALSADKDEYTFTCTVLQCNESFTVPKDQVVGSYVTDNTDPCLGNSQTPLAYGIDVSKWQGDISQSQWNEIANTPIDGHTITFAILRIGTELSPINGVINRQKDPYFESNYARAKAAGLHVGCYYLTESWSPQNAVKDAEQVIEWIGDKQFEYPVFFDIESRYIADNKNVPNNTVRTEICTAFMKKMREAGFFTGFYTYDSWIDDNLKASMLFPEYDFWYARYKPGVTTPNFWGEGDENDWAGEGRKFGMWQYTDKKYIAPITANTVDCDVAYKNYPLIIKALHLNNF